MKNQFGQNTNENISKISALEVYYFKVTTGRTVNDVVFLRMLPLGGAACVHYVA